MGRPKKTITRDSECQTNAVPNTTECGGIFPGEKWVVKKIKEVFTTMFDDQVRSLQNEISDLKSTVVQLENDKNTLNDLQQVTDTALEQLQDKFDSFQQMHQRTITHLYKKIDDQGEHQKEMKCKIDNLEQSSRKNNIRIVGLQEEENEDIKGKVITLARSKMRIQNIHHEDIEDICRLGRKHQGKTRDIRVTFTSNKKKNVFHQARKKIPYDKEEPVYINEDLTQHRSELFYQARKMRRNNKLFGAWTQDGNVLVKVKEHEKPKSIESYSQLKELLQDYEDLGDDLSTDSEIKSTSESGDSGT